MNFINHILDIIFPERCLSCGKNGSTLCPKCIRKLPRLPAPYSSRQAGGFSPEKNTLVLLNYGDKNVKRAIWLFKYRNKRALAGVFAEIIHNSLFEELSELSLMKNFTSPLLVPIPISAKRFRERGYNQTELMARELARLGNLELGIGILLKSRHTESQVKTRNKADRLKNLRGSFVVKNPEAIRGRSIILLDDVITTGATLSEARNTLKKAGAKHILSVAVAH